MTAPAIQAFVERLAAVEAGPACNNFFNRSVPANELRRRNLEIYLQEMLDRRPRVLLVGEAPGFRGMRITGVPFTNRTIIEGPVNRPCQPGRWRCPCEGPSAPFAPTSRGEDHHRL